LQREPDEEVQIGFAKQLAPIAPDRHYTLDGLPSQKRRNHQALVFLFLRSRNEKHARIGVRIVDEFGAAALNNAADDAFADPDYCGLDRFRDVAECHDRSIRLPIRIGQEDRAVVGAQEILGMMGNAVHHRRQLERGRDVAANLG